jgi:hypothetical protein
MELSFSAGGISYTANYVGDRPGKPGRWWYCSAIDVYIELPPDASEGDVINTFVSVAVTLQLEGC